MQDWVHIAHSSSVEETQKLAACLSQALHVGDVITLEGDLGAGKTHFTQGLAGGLGITCAVTSPTFNVMIAYSDGRLPLYHFDLYRLNNPEELEDIAFFDYVESDGVSVVEWAMKFEDEMPEDRLDIRIMIAEDEQRDIYALAQGEGARLLHDWMARL